MDTKFITLTKENIGTAHICCAFSDKKCKEGYELKKEWLNREFDNGYVFRRLDGRAKAMAKRCCSRQWTMPKPRGGTVWRLWWELPSFIL
jgi:hypothetical protein